MNFDAFAKALTDFMSESVAPFINIWEQQGGYPLTLHKAAGQAGLLRLGIDDNRALFKDIDRACLLTESLVKYGSLGITMGLGSHLVSLNTLQQYPQFATVVDDVLNGDKLIALAITEPQVGSDLAGIATTVHFDHTTDTHYLTGTKRYICNGTNADHFIVAAKFDGQLGLYLVDCDGANIDLSLIPMLGWKCLAVAEVHFERVAAKCISSGAAAKRDLAQLLGRERLNIAVMAQTEAEKLLTHGVLYSQTRMIQNKPLFKKQAILHKLAQMKTQISVNKSFLNQCIEQFKTTGLSDSDGSIAKNSTVSALNFVANETLQISGAYGCEVDTLTERAFRDAKLLNLGGGSNEVLNNIIGNALVYKN